MRSLKDRSASGSIDTRYVPEAGRSRTGAAAPSQCHAIVGSVTESAVPITVASLVERVFLTLTPAQMSRSAVHGKPSPAAGFAVGDARSGSTERWRLPSERARGAIASIYRVLAE
jgi:hypothetical protein